MNTSLSALTSPLSVSKEKKTQIQHFFPAVASPHGQGIKSSAASPTLGRPQEVSKGPLPPLKRSVSEGLQGSPSPVIATEDEWDDIDDFDLSGVEKYCRPPLLSSRGQQVSCVASQRSDKPPGSPGTAGGDHGALQSGETLPEAEHLSSSQQSVICLEDAAPCSSDRAVGKDAWQDLDADAILVDGREETRPGND